MQWTNKRSSFMETHYRWQTKLFSRKFDIYEYDSIVGTLEKERFSRKSVGEMKGFEIMFVAEGFFNRTGQILNNHDHTEIGQIEFNFWKHKAIIHLNEKDYTFSFKNFFMTRWSLNDENSTLIKFKSGAFKGIIDSWSDNPILLLAGFYIRNYFKQRQARAAAG